ncbi:MAG TPA: HAD family phosphatase [Geobacteraceae bacterium]|nr:HAD family phosphatase [Geobacteraceae bacterium]
MLAAVIFDFDGIIVDTEPIHYRAFQEVLVPLGLGYSWEEYLRSYIGYDDRDALRNVFRAAGRDLEEDGLRALIADKGAAFQRIIAAGVEPYPGVVELVRAVGGNLPLALCSGALPADIVPILRNLGIADAFDAVVTAADVRASKPDPESYSLAVARLQSTFPADNISPERCLAIEDTPAGIAAAQGAGIRVLAVTNSYPAEELAGADRIVSSLGETSLTLLTNLF